MDSYQSYLHFRQVATGILILSLLIVFAGSWLACKLSRNYKDIASLPGVLFVIILGISMFSLLIGVLTRYLISIGV